MQHNTYICYEYIHVCLKAILVSGKRFFYCMESRRTLGPPSLLQTGTGGSFPGGKVAGREADHSPLPSVEVKNGATQPLTHI
jgi:hypothetical protein